MLHMTNEIPAFNGYFFCPFPMLFLKIPFLKIIIYESQSIKCYPLVAHRPGL